MKVELMNAEPAREPQARARRAGDFTTWLLQTLDQTRDPLDVALLTRVLRDFREVSAESRTGESTAALGAEGGRSRKVSVSMPEDLTSAVQERVGRGEFSRYVSVAVARQLEADLLTELVELLNAEYGPVPDELLTEAEAAWPDAE
ncbi:hypothetical protein ACFXKD_23735 [Nocardiopsis aegyptia]|uniref:hypothetical protein n=1 Tax=Nocardiopsis aegyptia TaxID=220378 RepID=UPI00366D000E